MNFTPAEKKIRPKIAEMMAWYPLISFPNNKPVPVSITYTENNKIAVPNKVKKMPNPFFISIQSCFYSLAKWKQKK